MKIALRKQPHYQQQLFINCTAKEQLYGGAKRGGKSVALCQKAILLSYFFPGNRGLITRKDFTDLQDTTLNEFWQVCPPELLDQSYGNGGHHKGERCIRLKSIHPDIPSDILYRGLGGQEDIEKAKGLNLGWLAIDEPSEIDYETYKMVRAQLTWALPDGRRPPYMVLLGSNPEPGWVKERFIDALADGCAFIPSLPRQNPFLPPGWEQELRDTYDDEWVEKYLDGSWEVSEGQVFPELSDKWHVCDDIDTSGMVLIASIDHGTTGYTCMLIAAIDADSNMYIIDEHYVKDRLIVWHAENMKVMMGRYTAAPDPASLKPQNYFRYILIDPACVAKTVQGKDQLQSIADLYHAEGIHVVPAWNAIGAGIERIKQALHVNPHHSHPWRRAPNGGPLIGSPKLFINKRRCPMTWSDIQGYRKEILPAGSVRYIGRDHGLDNVRYLVNAQPRPADMSMSDRLNTPLQDQFFNRAHQRWAKKFSQPEGNWYSGL